MNNISNITISKVNNIQFNECIFESSARESIADVIVNQNSICSTLNIIIKFSILNFQELGLVKIWSCWSSYIIINSIVKVIDNINSSFINNIQNCNAGCCTTQSCFRWCSWSYTNISEVFKTCRVNNAIYRSCLFIPSDWTLNRIWKILIVIIIWNNLIIFANLTNIISPSKILFGGVINCKVSFISNNRSYICLYATDNTFNFVTWVQIKFTFYLNIIISD